MATLMCGVMILTIRAWIVNRIHGWIPAAFIFSTPVGVVGNAVQGADVLFGCSGVMFGIAFAGLGFETWISASSRVEQPR